MSLQCSLFKIRTIIRILCGSFGLKQFSPLWDGSPNSARLKEKLPNREGRICVKAFGAAVRKVFRHAILKRELARNKEEAIFGRGDQYDERNELARLYKFLRALS